MFKKGTFKNHSGAWLGLLAGTVLGIFVNGLFFILSVIIGEAFDRQRRIGCGE